MIGLLGIAMIVGSAIFTNWDKTFPPGTPTNPNSTSTTVVDEIIRNLQWGNIVFNTPTVMQFGEPETVELLLSPTKPIQQLQSELERQGEIESARVQISNRMRANLSSQGLKVQALVPEEQAIGSEVTTQWKWEVTPVEEGSQKLYLSLSAVITISERDAPIVIQTYSKDIEVQISIGQRVSRFLGTNWQWL